MRSSLTIHDTRRPRAGFSLVELLVVMAIIAILASLSFVVLGRTGEAAREAATRTELRILSGALRERVDAFHELTASASLVDPDQPPNKNSRVFRDQVTTFQRWYYNAHQPSPMPQPQPSDAASEVFVRKAMFKALFPQREEDLWGYNGTSNNGQIIDDSPMLVRMRDNVANQWKPDSWMGREQASTTSKPEATSSELLYVILTEGDVFGLPPSDIDGIDKRMIGDTDSDGNMEFLDGWGHPLQFYNWPTRLIKDNGIAYTGTVPVGGTDYPTTSLLISNLATVGGVVSNNAATATQARNRIDRDPEDPTRRLNAEFLIIGSGTFDLWTLPVGGTTITAQRFNSDWYHDLNTATMPLIVSSGPDGTLGLHLPTENGTGGTNRTDRLARVIATADGCQALGDNLTNQQRGPK